MAALVLQSAPCLLSGNGGALGVNDARARLRGLVVNNTVHLGSVPNNTFGTGRTDAEASVERTIPSFAGSSSLTIGGNTPSGADVTGAQLGFSDPNGCRISSLKWTGGCGAGPGTTLKCPFGTTDVSVSGSNNGVAFTSSHGVKVTVTNFGVATSPASATVSGGTAATYTVNVAPKGGPFPGPVTLSCSNLPAQATCTFNPAIVTPGSGGASSVLTLSTGTKASAPILLPSEKILPTPKILLTPLWLLALLVPLAWRWRRTVGVGFAGALALLVALQACGGGSNNGSSSNGGGGGGGSTGSVTVSPASLTFATQALGTTSQAQGVTFSNTTTSAITISGVSIAGDFAETNNCGGSLAASGSCNLNVTFTPTASGTRPGTLTINDTGAGNPHTVALSGMGQSGPTPAGTYNIGVSGTSESLVQSAAVTLTVQ
jgi:hypothetical protein